MAKTKIKQHAERFLWPDIIRIVAIYLVVQIHTSIPFYSQYPWSILSKMAIICVPLFVLLSGSLLLEKKEDYKTFFQKRCLKVLIPWVIWTIIYLFYFLFYFEPAQTHAEFFLDGRFSFIQWVHFFLRMFLSNLWFLTLIFSMYLLTPLIRIFVNNANDKDIYYFLFLWFFSLSLLPFFIHNALFPQWEPNMVFTALQYTGYFIVGYFLIKKNFFKPTWKTIFILFGLGIIPLLIGGELINGFLNPGTVISSIAFFVMFFLLSNRFENSLHGKKREIITKISQASLGVYVIHKIISDFLSIKIVSFLQTYHAEFLLTMIIFLISTAVVIFLKRLPLIKYIVP